MIGIEYLFIRRSCSYIILVVVIFLLIILFGVEVIVIDEGWVLLDFKNVIFDLCSILRMWKFEDFYFCEWLGISCDKNFYVIFINFCNVGLLGIIVLELYRL